MLCIKIEAILIRVNRIDRSKSEFIEFVAKVFIKFLGESVDNLF